jgi:hypothetical protein
MEASRAKHRVDKSATQQQSQPTKRNTATVIGKSGHGALLTLDSPGPGRQEGSISLTVVSGGVH